MAFATLSDFNGEIDVTFFSRVWDRCKTHIEADKVVILRGKIEYQKKKELRCFIAEDVVNQREVEKAREEQDVKERKWEKFRSAWTYMADLKSGNIASLEKGRYTALGFLKSLRELNDKNGKQMAFGTLQDYEGEIDLVFFSRDWEQCRDFLTLDEFVALRGTTDPENDRNRQKPSFRVTGVADLASLSRSAARKAAAGEAPPQTQSAATPQPAANAANGTGRENKTFNSAAGAIHIKLRDGAENSEEELRILRNSMAHNTGGSPVFIHVQAGPDEKLIRASQGINAANDTVLEILNNCAAVARAWRE